MSKASHSVVVNVLDFNNSVVVNVLDFSNIV